MTKVEIKQYSAKSSSFLSDSQAKEVGPEIDRLSGFDGVNTQEIVDEATDSTSVLHDYFTWDDKKAANNWRNYEAGTLVRQIEVNVIPVGGGRPMPVRAFHAVSSDEPKSKKKYYSVDVVQKREDFSQEVTNRALNELETFHRKYNNYREVFTDNKVEINKVLDSIEEVQDDN